MESNEERHTTMHGSEYDFTGEFGLPTKEESLRCPEKLSEDGKLVHKTIMDVIRKHRCIDDPGGCKTFYSPTDWKARGEDYGHESELIVVYDGGDIGAYFDGSRCGELADLVDEMTAALEAVGYYYEPATCWYGCVYPL